MLKMALNAFWHNGFNIWKMTPADPPPQHMEFSICFVVFFFLKLPLTYVKTMIGYRILIYIPVIYNKLANVRGNSTVLH